MALPKHELGIAIRIFDGSYRGLNVLAIGILEQLELVEPAELEAMKAALQPAVTNVNGWTVGEFRSNLSLQAMRSPM